MAYVWHLLTTVLVGVAIVLARDALGSRRRRQHAMGARVRCPGRLGLDGDRPRRGRLELAGSGIRWTGGPAHPPRGPGAPGIGRTCAAGSSPPSGRTGSRATEPLA